MNHPMDQLLKINMGTEGSAPEIACSTESVEHEKSFITSGPEFLY